MIEALHMQLEPVRTVLQNDVNEILVCVDLKRKTGAFYTVITITAPQIRRQVAGLLAGQGLFSSNSDFLGSFTYGDSLNLVFLYRQESLLEKREAIYGSSFRKRKEMVESLLISLAETQVTGSVGLLLLASENINISPDATVYFNYFLDFAKWKPESGEDLFYARTAELCFHILSREYSIKYDDYLPNYPGELQVMQKKAQLHSFPSFNSILTFVKMIPDEPKEPSVGIRKLWERILAGWAWVKAHSMALFLVTIVAVTLIYTGYQIFLRVSYRQAAEKNTSYIGLENIGEVYLGDEDV